MREERTRDRRLALRHRWYAGGLAALLSGALIFGGVTPALASVVPPVETTPAEQTTDAVTPPAEETKPPAKETTPAVEETPDATQVDESIDPEPTLDGIEEPQELRLMTLDAPEITPLSAATGGATINVAVRVVRSGADNVAGTLAPPSDGALTLRLAASSGSTPDSPGALLALGANPWAVCVSDAAGNCQFNVPAANMGTRYWIVQDAVAAGYYTNPTLVTGNNTTAGNDRFAQTRYAFRTPQLVAGSTYAYPSVTGMPAQSNVGNPNAPYTLQTTMASRALTSGNLALSLANNRYTQTCLPGLKVALLIDLSTSMTTNNNEGLNGGRTAAKNFVRALHQSDAGAQVAIYTFGTNAPAPGTANQNRPLTTITNANVGTQAQFDNLNQTSTNTFFGQINALNVSGTQYTNWDRAFMQMANAAEQYDFAVVLTDGNPTVWGPNPSTQTWTTFQHVENSIFSANALKAKGAQVLTFGVGSSLANVAGDNLRAVSGTQQWTGTGSIGSYDYAVTTNWSLVANQLAALAASATCNVPIKVEKIEKPYGANPRPGVNWSFQAANTGQNGTLQPTTAQATDANGIAGWNVSFTSKSHTTTASITETPKDGWQLTGAECRNNGTLIAGAALSGNTISLPAFGVGDNIVCTVTNTQLPPTQLTLVKEFTGTHWGAQRNPADWALQATRSGTTTTFVSGVAQAIDPGTYALSEVVKAGFDPNYAVSCDKGTLSGKNITVPVNQHVTCTFTNKDLPAKFTFKKFGPNQQALAGGSFQLYSGTHPNGTAVGSPFAAVAGGYTSGNLAWGSYYIQEVTPPTGYLGVGDGIVSFVLGAGETATPKTVSLENIPAYKNLGVTKTAIPSFDRDYDWTLTKQVDRESATVRPGQNAGFDYTVTATPSAAQDSNFRVTGTITVTNPNPVPVTLTSISDTLPGANCAVTNPASMVVPAASGQQHGTLTTPYTCTLTNGTPTTTGTNTANIAWNAQQLPGSTGSASGGAAFDFANATKTITDDTVLVSDTAPEFLAKYPTIGDRTASVPGGKVFTYTRSLGADVLAGQCVEYPNEASIPATSDQARKTAKADVTVCAGADLTVSKTVEASFTRTYEWSIDKSVDATKRAVGPNGTATFAYTVTATPGSFTDSAWAMSGEITVTNPNAWPVEVDVVDTPSLGAGASCVVEGGQDAVIPAGTTGQPGTRSFDYECSFTGQPAYDGSNTATATWNPETAHTPTGTASDVEPVVAADWDVTEVEKTVQVWDDKTNPATPVELGPATWNASGTPTVFTYSLALDGPDDAGRCVSYTNNAWIEGTQLRDRETVSVCDYAGLGVDVTAVPTFDRAYTWTIDKSVDRPSANVRPGDSADFEYDVVVTPSSPSDSAFRVSGTITVSNPNDVAVPLVSALGAIAQANCELDPASGWSIPAATQSGDGTLQIQYSCVLTGAVPTTTGVTTSTVTWDAAALLGTTGTASADRSFTFADAQPSVTNGSAVVSDTAAEFVATYPAPADRTVLAVDGPRTFTYTRSLGSSVPAGECAQYPNTATVTPSQTGTTSSSATVTVCAPTGTVEKSAVSVGQNADGTWRVVYELVVTNPSTSGVAFAYDLADEFDFDAGVSVVGQPAVTQSPAGVDPRGDWNGASQPIIVSGVTLPANGPGDAQHLYRVEVTVTADPNAEGAQLTCQEGEPGAFRNVTFLYPAGDSTPIDEAAACAEPLFPLIEKTGGTTVDNGDGTFVIEYDVVVSYPQSQLNPLPAPITYVLTDAPDLPTGVELVGDWNAEAIGGAWPVQNPTWNGEGQWTIVTAGTLTPEIAVHTFRVFATVAVTQPSVGQPVACPDTETSGIIVWNEATLTSGAYTVSDDGCQIVHYDDVSLEKAASNLPAGGSVEPGDSFDYVLTVTNHGTRPAVDVNVTDDDLNERLEITGLTVSEGLTWGPAPGYVGNVVDLTIDSLGVGESATITVSVTFLPQSTTGAQPAIDAGDPVPAPPAPVELLENTACVTAAIDSDPDNNCDSAEVPTRDVTGILFTRCVNDAPLLGWSIAKSQSLAGEPIQFVWMPNTSGPHVPPSVELTHPGGTTTWSDEIEWPGTAFTPSGISIDYPGWRPLEAGDYVPGGGYYIPGTSTPMSAEQQAEWIFNGLILDPSELDYAWRLATTATFSVNPELVFTTEYPAATPACFVARHTEVQIEKTASVQRTEPGKSFAYDLAVANVSDDAAAESVVVTDVIPADLRVTDVTWPGKGDAGVFPNWETCAVAGQDASGFGGTLKCELFGPLQPVGANAGASSAPTITLAVTVKASSTASVIQNIAVVDYHTFGDPDDPGRDSDDATVVLSKLPATGGSPLHTLVMLGFLALLVGAGSLAVMRRRRGERQPVL